MMNKLEKILPIEWPLLLLICYNYKIKSWFALLGTSPFKGNAIKEAYKWIIIPNNSQQHSQHESTRNGESFQGGNWLGWGWFSVRKMYCASVL